MSTNYYNPLYCESLTEYKRLQTKIVTIGDVPMGGNYPIRVQSMTNTLTLDTEATVKQSVELIEKGCEYVRITTPTVKDAEHLLIIKKAIKDKGYNTPIIADIHFNAEVAFTAARTAEKIRINPGNFADKNRNTKVNYTDSEYNAELERIYERFAPLVKVCKEYGTAMRIGTNHGSLSERIMSKYGDTPLGMVESTMEFLRICKDLNFHNIVVSMKASNPSVMINAYRLLVSKMKYEGDIYPLHLGVTEAGDGEDGRIKSAIGIGCLLEDGIGDTIRVSLTEDPVLEIPVAKSIVERYNDRSTNKVILPFTKELENVLQNPPSKTELLQSKQPIVVLDYADKNTLTINDFENIGFINQNNKLYKTDTTPDLIYTNTVVENFSELPIPLLIPFEKYNQIQKKENIIPFLNTKEFFENQIKIVEVLHFVSIKIGDFTVDFKNKITENTVIVVETDNVNGLSEQRRLICEILNTNTKARIIVKRNYTGFDYDKIQLYASTDIGSILIQGFGNGIWINTPEINDKSLLNRLSFSILQCTRTRITRTEFISCPSCGRTLFNLTEVTAKVKEKTSHLKGLKIGIMGCIVNGPGEMADADYGYVGAGPGKVNLYKGKTLVKKGISDTDALNELILLIKENGDWRDE